MFEPRHMDGPPVMTDYKDTVFLPSTSFPMRGNLPQMEPRILEHWQTLNLYQELRKTSKGRPTFILHAGPPYANGHLHIGHAFTGIFKDVVVRYKQMQGFDAPYVPGWDSHGLPIEWKIEEAYRKKGKRKEEIDVLEFRQECRLFAQKWMDVQREESKRLGMMADWDHPYNTMDFASEATTSAELLKLLMSGELYQGVRPVMWSVVEKTALADTEVEYHDHTSTSVFVRFPVTKSADTDLEGASALIWTTTPWTLPGNRAVAYGAEITYALVEVAAVLKDSLAVVGERFIIAQDLVESVASQVGIAQTHVLKTFEGRALEQAFCRHCLWESGYEFDVPLLPGEHVTTDAGTGLVHTAPGHGPEDFVLGKLHGLEIPQTVGEDGVYLDAVPTFAGQHIFKIAPVMIEALTRHGRLLHVSSLTHSYPHSWRSKAPLIYRTTPQWFLSMEKGSLRDKALNAIEDVKWYPAQSRNRIRSMVDGRPDWCLSRQRAWGVPLPLFLHKQTGEPLKDDAVNARIVAAIATEGCDAWFKSDPSRFLGDAYAADDYTQIKDVLDVWFDSAATQAFVLEAREDLSWPADLYLEGSDQHRGWFQTSLLLGCASRGGAPFRSVITHGFALDEKGQKMSKSLGNGVDPQSVISKSGAEILRLWVMNCDYSDDYRVGPEILKSQEDLYRRFRNTLRYLLGALDGFDPTTEGLSYEGLPDLEKYILHRLTELHTRMMEATTDHTYQQWFAALHTFCAVDLSAFYFDIRKDVLYCDAPTSLQRRAARTVMSHLLEYLLRWLAPVLCFTTEEAWLSLGRTGSVHLETFETPPALWQNPDLSAAFETVRTQRRLLTGALEQARASGLVGSSLQARLVIFDPEGLLAPNQPWHTLAIVSNLEIKQSAVPADAYTLSDVPSIGAVVEKAKGEKCARCWQVLEEVGRDAHHPTLCLRCTDAVTQGARS